MASSLCTIFAMLLQITPEISVESTQKMCSLNIWKEDCKENMSVTILGLKPKNYKMFERLHTMNGHTITFGLTNLFSFSTKELPKPLSVR